MPLQIASGAPGGPHPTRFAKDVAVQRIVHQERQLGTDDMRRILLIAILLNLSRRNLFQLRHRYVTVTTFLRRRDVFDVIVGKHGGTMGIAINHRQIAAVADHFGSGFKHGIAGFIFDFGDEIRVDQITAVRQYRITAHQLHWGERSRTQRQRFGVHDVLRRETETLQIFRRVVDTHCTHGAHHHYVLRLSQPLTQANRAVVGWR
ncbi:hypothetical protein D3C79_344060 [compost metagenome]